MVVILAVINLFKAVHQVDRWMVRVIINPSRPVHTSPLPVHTRALLFLSARNPVHFCPRESCGKLVYSTLSCPRAVQAGEVTYCRPPAANLALFRELKQKTVGPFTTSPTNNA